MRPRIVALDLSLTATGAAWSYNRRKGKLCPDGLAVHTMTPATSGHERLRDILLGVADVCRIHPYLVVIEGLYVANHNNTLQLAELHGLVKQWLWTHAYPYVLVAPSTRAVYATGRGDAGKDEVLRAVRLTYGHLLGGPSGVADHNQADALTLLAMAIDEYDQPLADLPESHRRARRSVRWPALRHPLPGDAGHGPVARRGPRVRMP